MKKEIKEEKEYKNVYLPELGTYQRMEILKPDESMQKEMVKREKKNKSFIDKKGVIQFRFSSAMLEDGIKTVLGSIEDYDLPTKLMIIEKVHSVLKDKYNDLIYIE